MASAPVAGESIPAPPGLPVVGHLHQIARSGLIGHLLNVSRDFPAGIFKLKFGSVVGVFVTSADLVAELSDETRFRKMPAAGLRVVRKFAGDGLFTAFSDEPNWGKAHRILLPAFSQRAMRGYFDMILEVCDQLVTKWERLSGTDVLVADDMTRLTLDSIAIAGFGHRFDSFEKEELDSFLVALGSALEESLARITRLPFQQRFAKKASRQFDADIEEMNALVDGIIADRRKHPTDGKDLLNLMLTAVDPDTGEQLDDINIRYQVLTFLIAGHETTSGLLTFAFHLLLRHSHVLAQAYAEVDRVLPRDTRPDYVHVAKFEVIERILKEAQRLWPTAPAFSVAPFEETVIGGRWRMRKDRPINVFSPGLHRDPQVWERPDEFDIDRWLPEVEAARHPHAYKPFGNGARACIGRQFAMVEAKLAMAMLLRRFAISDPHGYRLRIKETLSIKPDEFYMRIRLRGEHERLQMGNAEVADDDRPVAAVSGTGQRFAVLYGSSLGTAREIAEEIAQRAAVDGFETVVRSMDESLSTGNLPEDRVIVVVTATYNGRAPDTAVAVEKMLDAAGFDDTDWTGARFAVLGIGNSQWPNYQLFPKRIDAALEATGAIRLMPRAEADGLGDFDGAVAGFVRDLWKALGSESAPTEAVFTLSLQPIDAATTRAAALPEHAQQLEIVSNDELVRPADGLWDFALEPPRPSTRFVRIRLPEGQRYQTGDHIAVYARNRPELVERALSRLDLDGATQLRVDGQGGRFKHLPLGQTVTVRQLLTDFVELSDTLPRRALAVVAAQTRCPNTKADIARLDGDGWQEGRGQALEPARPARPSPRRRTLARQPGRTFRTDSASVLLDSLLPARRRTSRRPHRRDDGRSCLVGPWRTSWIRVRPYADAEGRRPRVRLCPPPQPSVRAARRSRHADDPDRSRHRLRALARLPAGARRARGSGGAGCHQPVVLRLPPPRPRLVLPRGGRGLGERRYRHALSRLLRGPLPSVEVRPGRALGRTGARLGRDRSRRVDLPVRRRQVHGARRPRHADPYPDATGRRRTCARLRMAGANDCRRAFPPRRIRFR